MAEDIYGLSGDDVDRIRRLLEAYEGGSRLKPADTARALPTTGRVYTYLALTTSELTAATVATSTLTTLNGAANDTLTTIPVNSVTSMPTNKPFVVTVGSERMLVSYVSTANNVIEVQRGYDSTTAANHANTSSVTQTVSTLGSGSVLITEAIENQDGNYELDEIQDQEETAYNPFSTPVQADTRVELIREPNSGVLLIAKTDTDADTYFALSSTTITARSGFKLGKGVATILTLTPDGGDEDWTPTSQTVTVYNACTQIAANTFLQLFREPISGKLMAVPLCVASAECPCEEACYTVSFPGLTSIFPCVNCETFAAIDFTLTPTGQSCAWSATSTLCGQPVSIYFNGIDTGKWRVTVLFGDLNFVIYEVTDLAWNCTDDLVLTQLAVSEGVLCDDWPATITVSPCGSGSGGDATCCDGNCADGDVSSTLTATVTDKVGCYAGAVSSFTMECVDVDGAHIWETSSDITMCSVVPVAIGCGPGGMYISDTANVAFAEAGFVCYPFAAVFLIDDGAGNSCTITVTG